MAALLKGRLGEEITGALARRIAQLCAGNPLLLELVAASIGQQTPKGMLPTEMALSAEGLVLTRFAGLPQEALDTARAA